jgi:hypothetical protein
MAVNCFFRARRIGKHMKKPATMRAFSGMCEESSHNFSEKTWKFGKSGFSFGTFQNERVTIPMTGRFEV